MLGAGTCLAVQYYVPLQQLFTSTWDLLLMAYFMSVRLKEGLTCMEESDPFAFEKKNPDFSDLRWRLYAVSAWNTSLAQVCTRCPYLYLLMDFIGLVSCGSGSCFLFFFYFPGMFTFNGSNQYAQNVHKNGLVQAWNGTGLSVVEFILTHFQLPEKLQQKERSSWSSGGAA